MLTLLGHPRAASPASMPDYAPPSFAAFATQLSDVWDDMVARWNGNPHVEPYDSTPRALTSITSSGTTATATLASHGFENGDSVSIRRADGAADTVYNSGYNVNDTVISNVTTDTFQYTMQASTGDADATGSPVVIPFTGYWGSSNSHNMGYYGCYHSLIAYCNWLDARGGDSSALRAVRHLPLWGELHRWRWGGSANGYPSQGFVRFPQVYSKALDAGVSTTAVATAGGTNGTFTGFSGSPYDSFGQVTFDGAAEYVTIPDIAHSTTTLSASIKCTTTYAGGTSACAFGHFDTNSQRSWFISVLSGKMAIIVGPSGTTPRKHYQSAASVNDGAEHTLGFTWDDASGTLLIYIDGVDVTGTATKVDDGSTTVHDSTAPLSIGCYLASGAPTGLLPATLRDARLHNSVLSAANMLAIHDESGQPTPDYAWPLFGIEGAVTITDMTNCRDLGAYNATVSKINEGPADGYPNPGDFPFYTQRSREFSYQWEAQTHCEIQGEARITGYLTNVTMQECVEGFANNCYRWLYEIFDAQGGPDTDEDFTNGHAVFMMAISCMAAIHYYDHEVSLANDPEQYWPATVMDEYSGTGSGDYITNPNTSLLGTITDMAKWVFDYTGVSGTPDTDAVGKRAAYLRCHATTGGITLGDPMVYESGGLLLSWYRTKDGTNSGTPILCMWMPVLYWLANQYKVSDTVFATWCIDKADAIMTTSADATYYPWIQATDGGAIKEGLERMWYQFQGLDNRALATGVPTPSV